jgi:dihydrofolate reductase
MTVSLIAAVAKNRVIGRAGKIPWRIPSDMALFKRLTMGHAVIMGRKTLESIGKPLAGRTNIVLTRDPGFSRPGVIPAHSPQEALERAREAAAAEAAHGPGREPSTAEPAEVFVAGGAEIYALFLPRADRLFITEINADIEGDELFPIIDPGDWTVIRSEPGGPGAPPHRFVLFERKRRE